MGSVVLEEYELMKDAKYRLYVSAIDKALKYFDSTNEWADLISALGKLNKVLHENDRFPVIPRRIKISKRLAQCMHFALPAGVHLKALETYNTIFKCMGTNRLSHELFIYSAGLFPLLGHSSINVKPALLTIYETHFVPLGERLRPGLSGFLSGVLPGLEEGSDHFERTTALLEQVCEGVGNTYFYGCLWESLSCNFAIRLPAISFVLSHFNKKLSMEDQMYIMGTNLDTMVNALCAGVQDSYVLVQRCSLDLLLIGFPMHNTQLVSSDMVRLITAALSTILRRDMSLNRRLYAWLLGSEVSLNALPREHQEVEDKDRTKLYFETFSKSKLIQAVKAMLSSKTSQPFDIRPYRLLTSLLDKPDVGPVILDAFLYEVFRVLYHATKGNLDVAKQKQEVLKSANLLFTSLEPSYIWQYCGYLYSLACKQNLETLTTMEEVERPASKVQPVAAGVPNLAEVCELVEFLLGVIPLETTTDASTDHLTQLSCSIMRDIATNTETMSPQEEIATSLGLVACIVSKIQSLGHARGDGSAEPPAEGSNKALKVVEELINQYMSLYVLLVGSNRVVCSTLVPEAFERLRWRPDSKPDHGKAYAEDLRRILNVVLKGSGPDVKGWIHVEKQQHGLSEKFDIAAPGHQRWEHCFKAANKLLVLLSSLPFSRDALSPSETVVLPWLKLLVVCSCWLQSAPRLQLAAIATFLQLAANSARHSLLLPEDVNYLGNTDLVKVVTETLWAHLGDESELKVSSIHLLYQLHTVFASSDAVERVIGEALLKDGVDAFRRFTTLWHVGREITHGNPKAFHRSLLKVVDNLQLADSCPLRLDTQTWLTQSLMRGDLARLLSPILVMLLDPATARMGILHVSIGSSEPQCRSESLSEDSSHKIYAISSVDGNVIYHVSSNSTTDGGSVPKRLKWRWKKEVSLVEGSNRRVYAVTSLKQAGDSQHRYVTVKNMMRDIELPKIYTGSMSVFVNPLTKALGQEDEISLESEHLPESIRNARRFNATTGQMEDIEMDLLPRSCVKVEVTTAEELQPQSRRTVDAECEESQPADEYFCEEDESLRVAKEVMSSLVDKVVSNAEVDADGRCSTNSSSSSSSGAGVHPLHSHMLLYCGVYDSQRTLYALSSLKALLLSNSRLSLWCTATSAITNSGISSELLLLLARHRKSVFGRSFHGDVTSLTEYMTTYRSSMFLEVLVSVCLYFARSYYPNLGLLRLTSEEMMANRQVQLSSIELLMHILRELIPIVRCSGKGFANYIADLLARCKVQKIVLHSILSSLHNLQHQNPNQQGTTFTEEMIHFNDPTHKHSVAIHEQLVKVLQALIMLEHTVDVLKAGVEGIELKEEETVVVTGSLDAGYTPGSLISHQAMFHNAILTALRLKGELRRLHYSWTELVTSTLPCLGTDLSQIVVMVIQQICLNLEQLALGYLGQLPEEDAFPADYAITQLEALTALLHFCVLDSSQQPQQQHQQHQLQPAGQILANLVHVFTPMALGQDVAKERAQPTENFVKVRRIVLWNLPRVIASIAQLWRSVTLTEEESSESAAFCLWGCPRIVRNQMLELLSPICFHHGVSFLAAVAVAWQEMRTAPPRLLPVANRTQQVLVNVVSAIRVMPIDTLVQTVHQVVKQPPSLPGPAQQDNSLDVSILELFYVYMQSSSGVQLGESWTSLLALLKDGVMLTPPALFLVLAILNEFVQRSPALQDKKDQRDLQDMTSKLVESCGTVAGACLEQTTWLRKNLSVKEGVDMEEEEYTTHSVQAQLVLAQILAPLLDVAYGSQEKEKVAVLLTNLMYNITPYLRNHLPKNAASFQACSQLLSSLSGFQYTRKAWKRDVFELLLEPSLFQMDAECLTLWTCIVDNLMTHDMTTFRDLMSRISVAQSSSYSLFSSREQEYEQRALLLKRLAFVILCSETDQYHKFIHTIQERLCESLRLPSVVPSVQAQVFLCFRVLLLRMSPHHVTSLWPTIISEMVQVLMHIEQELCTDSEEFSSHIKTMSALDASWVLNTSNGLDAHGHPHWLQLTLAAAKLLDLAVLLPAQHLPQFQMYKWAFVGDTDTGGDFVPHVLRIARLMNTKFGRVEGRPGLPGQLLLNDTSVDSLQELHTFFASLPLRQPVVNVDMSSIETNILQDFLEKRLC